MKPTTKIAIAGLLAAAGAVLNALAAEFNGGEQSEATPETPAPKRGKKAAAAATPAAETAETATDVATPEPAANGAKTYDDLRAMIEPLVKAGQGPDVKTVIAKYAEGGLKELATKPEHHVAFEKDLAALSY